MKDLRKYMLMLIAVCLFLSGVLLSADPVRANETDKTKPSTPTGLTAKAISPATIELKWNAARDNVAVVGYDVFRNGRRVAAGVKNTSIMDVRLTAASTYQYVVKAVDGAGNRSASSKSVSAKTLEAEKLDPRYGVYYEIFVRSFYDTDNNGIGDFNGITQKLDYLQDLGIEGIWLMPIHPTKSYHGYDVIDYYGVNPEYGTLDDFKRLLSEAKARNIKIILDGVFNHSGNQHPWFISAASESSSKYRNWYMWADNKTNLGEKSATGGTAWHKANTGNYLGTFSTRMPDFNLDNPDVRTELGKIGAYWLEMGVAGFRLDAAKHAYDDLQSSAKKPETAKKNQQMWQQFRQQLRAVNPDAYLVGEVWDSNAVIAPFLDNAFQSAFNFDLASWMMDTVKSGKASQIAAKLKTVYELYNKSSNGEFIDATFLTNHDKDRVMSVLKGNKNQAKLAAAMMLTLPGIPYIYYGEELGMQGAKPDENIRLPFPWYGSGSGEGLTRWRAEGSYAAWNREHALDRQIGNEDSLHHLYKSLIRLRASQAALRQGDLAPYISGNGAVESYVRGSKYDTVLVLHNISTQKQTVRLDRSGASPKMNVLFSSQKGWRKQGTGIELPPQTTVILK